MEATSSSVSVSSVSIGAASSESLESPICWEGKMGMRTLLISGKPVVGLLGHGVQTILEMFLCTLQHNKFIHVTVQVATTTPCLL